MSYFQSFVGELTIPATETESNSLSKTIYEDAVGLLLVAPDALDAVTYTIVTHDDRYFTGDRTLQAGDPVADLAPPLAEKARMYYDLPACPNIKIVATGAAAADRTWEVYKLANIDQ